MYNKLSTFKVLLSCQFRHEKYGDWVSSVIAITLILQLLVN